MVDEWWMSFDHEPTKGKLEKLRRIVYLIGDLEDQLDHLSLARLMLEEGEEEVEEGEKENPLIW